MSKCILCFSGGLDSTVLLWHLKLEHEVKCISFDYGQRHRRELEGAKEICKVAGVEHRIADLSNLKWLFAGSSQTSPDIAVPEGHYAEESMLKTVVPNRNMVMMSLAGAWAISTKSDAVCIAAHAGDHYCYWDCRDYFMESMASAFLQHEPKPIHLLRPFVDRSKTMIVIRGWDLRAPLHLTRSCYNDRDKACGRCGTCCERLMSFAEAGLTDPIEYEDREYYKTVKAPA